LYEAAPHGLQTVRKTLVILLFLLVAPIAVSAVEYLFADRSPDWRSADRSSAGLLPSPAQHPEALVRVYAARTVRWRGIFAVHSWIVVKQANATSYTRYDYTAWGEPIRINGFAPPNQRPSGAKPLMRIGSPQAV
jgi:hypothetical protein